MRGDVINAIDDLSGNVVLSRGFVKEVTEGILIEDNKRGESSSVWHSENY